MEREGLGRGIGDISHLFLSAREKRLAEGGAAPGSAGPGQRLVWVVLRAGEPAAVGPEAAWALAWRLAVAGTHTLSLALSAETVTIRWLGQAADPPTGLSPADLITAADNALLDLTDAPPDLRRRLVAAARELVVICGVAEADALAAYALMKAARETWPDAALGLEVVGAGSEAEAVRSRLLSAARHFLNVGVIDWRERYPVREAEGRVGGPEPPLVAAASTAAVLEALVALASSGAPRPAAPSAPVAAAPASAVTPGAPSAPVPAVAAPAGRVRPLLAWPEPDVAQLAQVVRAAPHLVGPHVTVLDEALHPSGEGVIDLLGADDLGRPVGILVSRTGDAALLAAGLAFVRWCLREQVLLRRLHGALRPEAGAVPALILAACRFDEAVVEAARSLSRPPVWLVELRAYELAGERAVAAARLV